MTQQDEKAKKGSMKYMSDLMQITCIVQRGKADTVVDAAIKAGAPAATIFFGRGTGIRQRLGLLKIAINPEKEMIEIIVPHDKADIIFEAMVKEGKMEVPGMGVIYMTPIAKALIYQPESPATESPVTESPVTKSPVTKSPVTKSSKN